MSLKKGDKVRILRSRGAFAKGEVGEVVQEIDGDGDIGVGTLNGADWHYFDEKELEPYEESEEVDMDPWQPIETKEEGRAHDINSTLEERQASYGNFAEHARITQNLKDAMVDSPNWDKLTPDMKEALEMNMHKIGRILNGDPTYKDSWHDIVGYIKLVDDTL